MHCQVTIICFVFKYVINFPLTIQQQLFLGNQFLSFVALLRLLFLYAVLHIINLYYHNSGMDLCFLYIWSFTCNKS